MAKRQRKKTAKRKGTKSIVSGGSYDIRPGRLNRGGMPYFMPSPAQQPVIVQLPPQKSESEKQRETWRHQAERREMLEHVTRVASRKQQGQEVTRTKEDINRKDTKEGVTRVAKQRIQQARVEESKGFARRKDVLSALQNPSKVSELEKQGYTEWIQTAKGRQSRDALMKQIRERSPMESTSVADAPYEERLSRHAMLKESKQALQAAYVDNAPMQSLQVAPSLLPGFTMGQGPPMEGRKRKGRDWVKTWVSPPGFTMGAGPPMEGRQLAGTDWMDRFR